MPKRKEQAQGKSDDQQPLPRGRPTLYKPELAAEICRRIAEGESLRAICRDDNFPTDGCVRGWYVDDREGFSSQYARAWQIRALSYGEEIVEISDDGSRDYVVDEEGNERVDHDHIQRSKLRVDSRKWIASKMLPKVFGDTLKLQGDPTAPVTFRIEGLEK